MASAQSVASQSVVHPRERSENFPVALRVLPRRLRSRLHEVYDLSRRIDDAGDDPRRTPDERLATLDALAGQIRHQYGGTSLERPFLDLIEANRLDQTVARYPTIADLLDYCRLSANPVGRLVLSVFDVDDAETARLSDLVCSALQLIEHCQDVGEDRRDNDRIYLPLEDLVRFGVDERDLDATHSNDAVRTLVGFEVDRAQSLLDEGAHIVRRLHGWARLAVAGYIAGGRATIDALRRADNDVLATTPRPRAVDVVRRAAPLVWRRA